MALAGAGGTDEAEVLLRPHPFEAREVVEGALLHGGDPHVELLERLGHREGGHPQPVAGRWTASREAISASTRVRKNSSGFHRWVLAVTNNSGESERMAREAQSPKPGLDVGGQGRWGRVHDRSPMA